MELAANVVNDGAATLRTYHLFAVVVHLDEEQPRAQREPSCASRNHSSSTSSVELIGGRSNQLRGGRRGRPTRGPPADYQATSGTRATCPRFSRLRPCRRRVEARRRPASRHHSISHRKREITIGGAARVMPPAYACDRCCLNSRRSRPSARCLSRCDPQLGGRAVDEEQPSGSEHAPLLDHVRDQLRRPAPSHAAPCTAMMREELGRAGGCVCAEARRGARIPGRAYGGQRGARRPADSAAARPVFWAPATRLSRCSHTRVPRARRGWERAPAPARSGATPRPPPPAAGPPDHRSSRTRRHRETAQRPPCSPRCWRG